MSLDPVFFWIYLGMVARKAACVDYYMGKVMQSTQGRANPDTVRALLHEQIDAL